jgi:putative RecB family exonuclease
MALDLPRSLSPSKVSSFRDCALAFRFSAIDHLPEEPTIWTVKGTLVHRALERLFWEHRRGRRSPTAAAAELGHAWDEMQLEADYLALDLGPDDVSRLRSDAEDLVGNYFALEDPNEVNPVGIELTLETRLGAMRLRGILDRLDLTPEGDLVVVDYKTGRAPSPAFEQSKLVGVNIYALLCQEVFGRRPVQVKLLHLKEPTSIIAEPSDQALRGQRQKAVAVWSAIEQACEKEDFRPRPSRLCDYCDFKSFCPAFGGNPDEAVGALATPVASAV